MQYQYPAIAALDASGCYCLVPLGEALVRWSLPLSHGMVDTDMSPADNEGACSFDRAVGGEPRTRAVETFEDLVFGENSRWEEIVCLGNFEALLCRGWLTDLWWRSYDLQLHASYRLYLFPTFSLVLPAPMSASTSALPNWQWVLPTRHFLSAKTRNPDNNS